MVFDDLCQDIWAGCRGITRLSSRFDSSMVSEDSTVRVEKEIYLIDYTALYVLLRNQLKMQSVWNLRRKIRNK